MLWDLHYTLFKFFNWWWKFWCLLFFYESHRSQKLSELSYWLTPWLPCNFVTWLYKEQRNILLLYCGTLCHNKPSNYYRTVAFFFLTFRIIWSGQTLDCMDDSFSSKMAVGRCTLHHIELFRVQHLHSEANCVGSFIVKANRSCNWSRLCWQLYCES